MKREVHPLPPAIAENLGHDIDCTDPSKAKAVLGNQGDPLVLCGGCKAYFPVRHETAARAQLLAALGVVAEAAPPPARMTEMSCVRCGNQMWVRPGRAVVPLCPRCREAAEAQRAARGIRAARGDYNRQRREAKR